MRFIIKTRRIELSDRVKKSIPKKFLKFEKWIPEPTIVELMLESQKGAKDGNNKRAILNVDLPHYKMIHLEAVADDIMGAIDNVEARLEVKLKRFRDVRLGHRRRDILLRTMKGALVYFPKKIVGKSTRLQGPRVIKRKHFALGRPVTEKEAIEEMKLLGHDFYIFKNIKTSKFSVVYRRHDKNFGIIECD